MQIERSKHIQAEEYERTEERKGYANGNKPKTVRTRIGEITFTVRKVREGGFYLSRSSKGTEKRKGIGGSPGRDVRLHCAAGTCVQGESTRKVKAITEELCGVEISAMQVSRATAQLDEVLQEWRERPLGEITYL